MTPIILAALLSFPIPPLGATMGTTPYHAPIPNAATRTELPATGLATYYAEGVFQRVLTTRGIQPDACPDCDGFAAMLLPGDMGRVVCIEGLHLLVVDVAASHHREALVVKGWLIDVDRETWLALGWQDTPTLTTVTSCE